MEGQSLGIYPSQHATERVIYNFFLIPWWLLYKSNTPNRVKIKENHPLRWSPKCIFLSLVRKIEIPRGKIQELSYWTVPIMQHTDQFPRRSPAEYLNLPLPGATLQPSSWIPFSHLFLCLLFLCHIRHRWTTGLTEIFTKTGGGLAATGIFAIESLGCLRLQALVRHLFICL